MKLNLHERGFMASLCDILLSTNVKRSCSGKIPSQMQRETPCYLSEIIHVDKIITVKAGIQL